jgi:hypothetical protein
MTQSIQSALARAIQSLLRPLTRVLIRNGIAYATFAEWAKQAYVEVAFDDFAEPGKKQTISRVSALTGIFRRDVKRLHDQGNAADPAAGERYNRAVRVISGWVNNAEFHDGNGQPARLPLEGETGSFAGLVKQHSGDIPVRAMLSVLEAAGSVRLGDDGRVELLQRAYIPGNDPVDKLHILGVDVAGLIATIDHNLVSPADQLFFQRKVSNGTLHPDAVEEFRRLSAARSQGLLEELDAWLSQHEISRAGADTGRYVSLGIYYAEQSGSEEA